MNSDLPVPGFTLVVSGDAHDAQLLQRIKTSDPTLTKLRITSKSSCNEAACGVLAHALSLNTCITSLNLQGTRFGNAGACVLFSAITHLTGMTYLNLRITDFGNSGARHLCSTLPHLTALTELNLSLNNVLTEHDGAAIISAAAAAGMTRLQILNLNGINTWECLKALSSLHYALPGACSTQNGLCALASLTNLSALTMSDHAHAGFSSSVAMGILRNDTTLVSVTLKNSLAAPGYIRCPVIAEKGDYWYPADGPAPYPGLTQDDVCALSHLLSFNSCITSLELSHNKLGSGAVELMRNLSHLTSLTHLRIDDQSITADDAAAIINIAFCTGMAHLRSLELECRPVVSSVATHEVDTGHYPYGDDNYDVTYTKHQISSSSTFCASDVLRSATWQRLQFPTIPRKIVTAGYGAILKHLFFQRRQSAR